MELYQRPAYELSEMLRDKKTSAQEITESLLNRIESVEDRVDAYITITADAARKKARAVDERIARGEEPAPMAGIPIAVKDNVCTNGVATTCASKMLENFLPPYDAAVMEKINQNDMVMLGKLNMEEFAMGSSCENSAFKVTRNPHDPNRVPGGSSGGSAASVAAMETTVSIGSDTGGSIRLPSAYCGVFGLKPTYGAVSRYGVVAYASSLDQVGPLARSARDIALMCNVLYGYDKRDSTSLKHEFGDFTADLGEDIEGKRIGLPQEYFSDRFPEAIRKAVLAAAREFEKMGAVVEETTVPLLEYAIPVYYIISCAEASSNLARFDGIKYGYRTANAETLNEIYLKTRSEAFGPEVQRRIMLGNYVLSSGYYDAYYKKALAAQQQMRRNMGRALDRFDMLLTPTSPVEAGEIGAVNFDPDKMYMTDLCTVTVNIAGVPAISVPCGSDSNSMPVGMQLIGNHLSDKLLVSAAYAYERHADVKITLPRGLKEKRA